MKHTIEEWAYIVHNNARVKGFYTKPGGDQVDPTDPIWVGSRIALIHSELSEVLECITRGKEALHFGEHGKPEGLGVELADVAIRTFDLAESLQLKLLEPSSDVFELPDNSPVTKASVVNNLHTILSTMAYSVNSMSVQVFLECLFAFAISQGVNLWEMIELKHEFNTTRPLRHGGKIL